MTDELTQCIDAGKISTTDAEKLDALKPGSYCKHRSWGFGRIAAWQLLTDQVIIDFAGKKNHPMQLQYAIETLVAIPEDHILARLEKDPEAIRQEAKKNSVELIRSILKDHGGAATIEEIAATLVPTVFDTASFKKWFDAAKKKLKADGHFAIPTKKTSPIELQEVKVEPHHRILEQFHASRHPKEQVAAIDSLLKTVDATTLSVEELQVLIRHLEEAALRAERLHTAKALELLLARNELGSFHQEFEEIASTSHQPSIISFLANTSKRLYDIFAELPAVKYRRILKNLPDVSPVQWQEQAQQLLRHAEPRLIGELFHLFKENKNRDAFVAILARMIQDRSASSDLLSWICEERTKDFPEFINSELLSAIISSLERDMHVEGKKGNRLQELLFNDRKLIADLLATASDDAARTVMRKIMMSPVFSDLDRRSLLARILKVHPELQSILTGHQEKENPAARDENLTVSWASLERRKNEYEHLVNKLIPQNTKDISIARSYGDLRENFEFKSAKEQQTVLLRQKGELELLLHRARGTNFENPDTSVVSIGTVVSLRDEVTGEKEVYSILGAWDGDPEKRWVSYQAVIGQALLGHPAGDVIVLPAEKGNRSMVIEKIEAFQA
ncbi:MAG: GreA/GreB family elongation factor [Chthoniobacterales bacterium]